MNSDRRLKVLLLAPDFDKNTPGESWSTYKWVEGISRECHVTVLTCHAEDWISETSPTEAVEIVNWVTPKLPGMQGRLAWELNPGYIFFYFRARRWIRKALKKKRKFDIAHQINPLALRYPSPLAGLGIPYIIGPLAGSLQTPAGFHDAAKERVWFRKLRGLDRFRIANDPWLRKTYSEAAAIIGVAPYVQELLQPCAPKRFEIMAETGVEEVASEVKAGPAPGEPLRLLFVGRIIRTKGILDGIRALALCPDTVNVRLDVVGDGDLLEICKAEVERLGITDKVAFHGRLSRDEVFEWYRRSHVFLFPSFREPSGNVVFEAMSQGLPVITSTVGGPGYVVDESCGFLVEPADPESYAHHLAAIITTLANQPTEIVHLSAGAVRRMDLLAFWPRKIEAINQLFLEILSLSTSTNKIKNSTIVSYKKY